LRFLQAKTYLFFIGIFKEKDLFGTKSTIYMKDIDYS